MKLIGAGFGRTGTMSLKAAIERLGAGPCYHMIDLIKDPSRLHHWQAATRGEQVDWTVALDGYEATIDWPGCTFYDQMMAQWPDAPVLLNIREPEAWYESCLNTIHAVKEAAKSAPPAGGGNDGGGQPPPPEVMQFVGQIIWEREFGGFERFREDRAAAIDVFERHNEAVRAAVPADRLLVYEIGEGWEPLCELLDAPVPDEPFPHLNDTASFRQMFGMAPAAA